MTAYLVRTPRWIQRLFPHLEWNVPTEERVVYLTFDDGPTPGTTEWIIQTLADYQAYGTFFCVGENVQRYPELIARLRSAGHALGNHTHRHLNAWEVSRSTYYHDIDQCSQHLLTDLFRPPYGKLRIGQGYRLARSRRVIMWDVLSGDFDPQASAADCLYRVVSSVRPGSIVVFHDSEKTDAKLRAVLPEVIRQLNAKGYRFEHL